MLSRLFPPLLASLTLGLAPFLPEPHLIGKLRWLAGGGVGMGPMDVFDLLMHGAPWLWLLVSLVREAVPRSSAGGREEPPQPPPPQAPSR